MALAMRSTGLKAAAGARVPARVRFSFFRQWHRCQLGWAKRMQRRLCNSCLLLFPRRSILPAYQLSLASQQ